MWSFLISFYFSYNILRSSALSEENSSLTLGGPTLISARWPWVMSSHRFNKGSYKYFPSHLVMPVMFCGHVLLTKNHANSIYSFPSQKTSAPYSHFPCFEPLSHWSITLAHPNNLVAFRAGLLAQQLFCKADSVEMSLVVSCHHHSLGHLVLLTTLTLQLWLRQLPGLPCRRKR